nr:MAG TPA: hypothetical protein [Caudoviricetes sp.]DAP17975.1 MAG TPA: hypothetical protein [Bacteriophage sp.]
MGIFSHHWLARESAAPRRPNVRKSRWGVVGHGQNDIDHFPGFLAA